MVHVVCLPTYGSFQTAIWCVIVKLEVDKHLLMSLEKFSPMLEERQPVGSWVYPSRGSVSSDFGRGLQRDRVAAASKALHSLRERRLQADPYPLNLLTYNCIEHHRQAAHRTSPIKWAKDSGCCWRGVSVGQVAF